MNLEAAKLKIIQLVTELQSEASIKQLLAFLTKFNKKQTTPKKESSNNQDHLSIARLPTPTSISLESLKQQQGYNMEKLNQTYSQLD